MTMHLFVLWVAVTQLINAHVQADTRGCPRTPDDTRDCTRLNAVALTL